MQTAANGYGPDTRPVRCAAALGKLLATAIILIPLAAMILPELKHRSGNRRPVVREDAPAKSLIAADLSPAQSGQSGE